MFTDYLSFGGTEIANTNRLRGYAESAGCRAYWIKGDLCENLRHALDHALPYTYETIDQAPWYDPSQRDLSSRFYGVMVVDADGIQNSSRQIATTEGIVEGGTIGSARRAMKKARFKVMLLAEGDDALDYGIAWLSSALDADKCGQHGGRCGVTDLEFFTTCPEEVMEVYAGDALVPDTPQHVIEGLRDQDADLEPIVNHAPPIEGSGNWAPVYENLFTNPRLKGDGTWAEVRRNLALNPRGEGANGTTVPHWRMRWSGGGTAVAHLETHPEGGVIRRWTAGVGVNWEVFGSPLTYVTPGEVISARSNAVIEVAPAGLVPGGPNGGLRQRLRFLDSSGKVMPEGLHDSHLIPWEDISVGEPFIAQYENVTVPDGADAVEIDWVYYGSSSDQPPFPGEGTVVRIFGTIVESRSTVGPYFDGSTPDFSVDPDMRQRWLGTPNDSESVMEIERVEGLTAVNCIAGVSSWDGKPAVRLIPTDASNLSYAWSAIPVEARTSGTALGTLHLDEPLTGSLNTDALSIRVHAPAQKESTSNAPGKHPLRLRFSGITSGNTLRLYHGGAQDSGDVWWTDIGLFAGNYPYEAFNGESDPAETGIEQPEDFRIRWTGAVDNSTSVMEIERVEGLSGLNAIAGVSTRNGKPAVRVIPTGSGLSMAFAVISTTASSVTGIGTVSLDAPLQGTLDDFALSLGVGAIGIAAPNLAGDHPLRVMGEVPHSGQVGFSLSNGATQGNGDVWWSDIGLFEGEYNGPTFNADAGWFQVDGNWYYATRDTDGLTTAYPGRAIFTYPTDDIKRFMHDVATSSGPLLLQQMKSGPHRGALMEFTITSERGYIYTAPRELNLEAAELSAAADQDINLIRNPAFEAALSSRVAAGYNLASNPSVETNTNNWYVTVGAGSRTNLTSAYGDYSYMSEITGSEVTLTPILGYSQSDISIPGAGSLAGKVRKLSVGMWGAVSVSSGAAQPTVMAFYVTVNGSPMLLESAEDVSQFGGYYFMHEVDLPSDWDGNISLSLQATFLNSGTSTMRLFGDGVFIGLGGV